MTCGLPLAYGEDWPEWRGRGRTGVWNESGIVERLPAQLTPAWRTPIRGGYSGPSVAAGRVYVTDYANGVERALCLSGKTGKIEWMREWPVSYIGLDYASGPRATPTVDGDRVYVLGAMGNLLCLRTASGEIVWQRDYRKEFGTVVPAWGMSAAPLIYRDLAIAVPGGKTSGKIAAFDKLTGAERWRALSSEETEPGYSQPLLINAGGRDQLIMWHAGAVTSFDPLTGRIFWEHPFKIHMNTPIATPVQSGPHLLVSAFFQGARLFRLDSAKPDAELVWRGQSESERATDTIHALMASPIIDGDHLYGICNYGQLRCLERATGKRVWESMAATKEQARNVSAFLVRHGERTVIFNDRGELIFARLTPKGYKEISRTELIKPTSKPGARRERNAVAWAHPAFANRAVIARNDEEIIRVNLEQR